MKKNLKLTLINVVILIISVLIIDVIIYKNYARNFYKTHPQNHTINSFGYVFKADSIYKTDLRDYFVGGDITYSGRLPVGTEYKNAKPITIFGGSFAHGQYLEVEQTMGYKLAHKLKRPVYNRAIPGCSFQQMYYQTTQKSFYDNVPQSDTVIYVMMNDHYRRMLVYFFDILDLNFLLHYSLRDNFLVMDNYDNKFANFFKSLYISKLINQKYVEKVALHYRNQKKLIDTTLKYFIKSKNNLEQNWGKEVNFIVILYDNWDILYKEQLKTELEKYNFIVIDTKELTNENLNSLTYLIQENGHPTEAAWDLLTPLIIEKLNF